MESIPQNTETKKKDIIFLISKMKKNPNEKKGEKILYSSTNKFKLLSFKKIKAIIREYIGKTKFTKGHDFHKLFKLSDLESNINFKYLSFLKDNSNDKFNKYIKKYIYTLDYVDAKEIGNLKTIENNELNKLNMFRSKHNIKTKINKINSLSNIKLVNFIYQLNNYYKANKDINDYKKLLLDYCLNTNLKYRLPNFCGNTELIFYTYLQLFIELFSFETYENIKMETEEIDKEENINQINFNEDLVNEEEDCFSLSDWSSKENDSFEFNNNEINKDINDFFEFIKNNNKMVQSYQISEEKLYKKDFKIVHKYLRYLNSFDIYIEKKMLIDYNKKEFLDEIDYIYFTITYFRYNNFLKKNNDYNSKLIKYCLYEPEDVRNNSLEIIKKFYKDDKIYLSKLEENVKESLIYTNLIECEESIEQAINNHFNNCSIYYKFPTNMKKNIILFDDDFYDEIKKFLLKVYESKLFREIFYLTDEFKDFLYPFEGEDKDNIFTEMFEITKFYPFEFDNLQGYTNKILPRILISSIIKDCSNIEKIIISFAKMINTLFHEQIKHYIKMLIHYNSLRLNLSVSLESEKPLNDENFEKYFKVVQKKKEILNIINISKDEIREIKESDGGDKMEILLYGQKLQQLYISGALNILDINSYNKNIKDHLKDFLEQNKACKEITLDENNSLLKKLINLVKRSIPRKRIIRTALDGKISLQIASSATQIPGAAFIEFQNPSIRGYYGTS